MSSRRALPLLLSGVVVAAAALLAAPAQAATHQGITDPITMTPTLAWDAPFVGEVSATQTVTVTATTDVTIGSVAVSSPAEASFVVLNGTDTCTGQILAASDTCTIGVAAAPRALTPTTVTEDLVVTTTTPDASVSTPLTLTNPQLSVKGQYHAQVGRVMDTRSGAGVRRGAVGPRGTVTLKVAGRAGVPASGVSAVVLNLTVTGGSVGGYVTAYPAGQTRPTASSINFTKGWTGANLVTVPLGTDGSVTFYNNSGTVQLVADIVGYYVGTTTFGQSDGSDYFSITPPYRMFDSRTDWGYPLKGGYYVQLHLGFGDAFNPRVKALAVTVTVTGATGTGYLAVLPYEPTGPLSTSSLNYTKGDTIANMSVASTTLADYNGTMYPTFYIANVAGRSTSVHVIVDVVGVYGTSEEGDYGDRFKPVRPTRIVDTRSDLGLASIGARVDRTVPAPVSVAGRDTWSLVGNLTGVLPTSKTYLKLWDTGAAPTTSALNLDAKQVRANSAWTGLSAANTFNMRNYTGSLDVVYDVSGSFELFPGTTDTLAGVPWQPSLAPALRDGSSPRTRAAIPDPAAGGGAERPRLRMRAPRRMPRATALRHPPRPAQPRPRPSWDDRKDRLTWAYVVGTAMAAGLRQAVALTADKRDSPPSGGVQWAR